MAKRFTDTGKWKRPWFRALGVHAKLVWQYLCDECDHAGIWVADFDLLTFQVGFKVDAGKLKEWLGDKLVLVDGDKYFIPSFIEFQYGAKETKFKARQSAISRLADLGLIDSQGLLIDLTNSYLRVTEQSPDCLSISKGKSKSISNTGSAEGAAVDADYEAVYQKYPKKVGKSDGLAKLKKLCPLKTQLDDFERAMNIYVEKCKASDTFLKQFDTFVNWSWRDCLDPTFGQTGSIGEINWDKVFEKPEGAA